MRGAANANPGAKLALARLTDSPTERVGLLLSALSETQVSANQVRESLEAPLYVELLSDLADALKQLRAQYPEEARKLDGATRVNLANLGQSVD